MSKNVRGKGKKDQRIKHLESVIERQQQQIDELTARLNGERGQTLGSPDAEDGEANAFTAPVGKVRRRQVRARAYDLYMSMGGDVIDQQLRNAKFKARAFAVQIRAAEVNQPNAVYGPNITPYEDRMSGSLVARLVKEKRALMDVCLEEARIDADECEELGADFEAEYEPARGEVTPPRLAFTDEEKQSLLNWIRVGEPTGEAPEVAEDIQRAIMYGRVYPAQMPADLLQLLNEVDKIKQSGTVESS